MSILLSQQRSVAIIALIGIGSLLFSIIVTTFLSPIYSLIVIGILAGGLIALYFTLSLRRFVWLVLVTKPLLDLTWRWRFLEVAEQGVNFQTLVALLIILTTSFAFLSRRKQVILDSRGILLLAAATLSVLVTPTSWGINELIRLYAGVSFLFTAGIVMSREDSFNKFAKYFILATSVPVLLSFLQRVGLLPFEYWDWIEGERVGRVSGTYQHPLGLIYFLIYAIPLSLYLLSYSECSRRNRVALWIFIALSLLAIVFTYHRMGLVVVGLELWLWWVLTKKYVRAVLLILLGGLAVFWFSDWIGILYENVVAIVGGKVAFSSGEFLRGRGMNWYLFLSSLFQSHPLFWLIGRGGSVAEGFAPHFGYWSSNEPHNDFIRILHAYGFIGLVLYASILLSFFWKSLRLRCLDDHFLRYVGNLMIVVLVSIILMSITTEPMRYPSGVWYLFAIGAVVEVQYRQNRNRSIFRSTFCGTNSNFLAK